MRILIIYLFHCILLILIEFIKVSIYPARIFNSFIILCEIYMLAILTDNDMVRNAAIV